MFGSLFLAIALLFVMYALTKYNPFPSLSHVTAGELKCNPIYLLGRQMKKKKHNMLRISRLRKKAHK